MLKCCKEPDVRGIRHATRSSLLRTSFADALKGSSPARRTVSMKRSCLLAILCLMDRYVIRTASTTSDTSCAEKEGLITLPGCAAPLVVEPADPPSVI